MTKFINSVKKYFNYMIYAAKAELNSEVANSYLGWLWWLLNPLFFMLIYAFVSVVVFKSGEPYFAAFVFIGLSLWDFFNRVVSASPRLVVNNKEIVSKVYLPKYILLIEKIFVSFFKMLISLLLVVFMLFLYKVDISLYVFNFIPILVVLVILTFGVSSILLHFGVFVDDLSNLVSVGLKLVFYLSGIFYLVSKRIPSPYNNMLLWCNPIAYFIESSMNAILYAKPIDYSILFVWLIIGIVLSVIGIKTINKYENSYVKVIK